MLPSAVTTLSVIGDVIHDPAASMCAIKTSSGRNPPGRPGDTGPRTAGTIIAGPLHTGVARLRAPDRGLPGARVSVGVVRPATRATAARMSGRAVFDGSRSGFGRSRRGPVLGGP